MPPSRSLPLRSPTPMAARRCAFIVVGFDQAHYRTVHHQIENVRSVDVRNFLHRDPEGRTGDCTPVSVCKMASICQAANAVLDAALARGVVVVGCRRGRHRSVVVSKACSDVLIDAGYEVKILELNLLQAEHLDMHVDVTLEWACGDRVELGAPNSYGNWSLHELIGAHHHKPTIWGFLRILEKQILALFGPDAALWGQEPDSL